MVFVLLAQVLSIAPARSAPVLPAGFRDDVVISGLVNPTVVKFAPDGRVFVAEKSGLIKVFDHLTDTSPTTFADLRTNVHNFWDRGLLGMTLHPQFPANPSVYVLYAHDAAIGGQAPRWGTAGQTSDGCPNPPGATGDGCVISGRLSRLQASGNQMTGAEQVLIEDWCQQYPSHSIGALAFGADGYLYASGGDGASFNFTDYGQDGNPLNPCGDPPGPPGTVLTPPTAEGGALRSQDVRTMSDPLGLDGTVIRIDPQTGAGVSGNPLFSSGSANARRLIATGFRNPFRFAIRPGTSEVWVGDVGWSTYEEINRVVRGSQVVNFGWPCYEGPGRQGGYDGANLNLCENLYSAGTGAVVAPYFPYRHGQRVVETETCPTGSGSSTAGLAFIPPDGPYPDAYDNALVFADYSRDCIWTMRAGANGLPDPATRQPLVQAAENPVSLEIGPGGFIYYPDFNGGTIRRIAYSPANQPPTAVIAANPTQGAAPLTVTFDGSGSADPDEGDALTYVWDLDGDGQFDDATGPTASRTYTQVGNVTVRLRVTDLLGAADDDAVTISVGNTAPTATISNPASGTTWRVGDAIGFSGSATDPQQGTLPASALDWDVILHHCETTGCHQHHLQSFAGVASGSLSAPDHEYPSHLELRLTATDAGGLTSTAAVELHPRTVDLTVQTAPAGLQVALNGASGAAPLTRTVIVGSTNSISAPSPQTLGGTSYQFTSWSDGGAQNHNVTAGATNTTYTATFQQAPATWQPYAKVNFQPSSAPTVSGYLVDGGATYGSRGGSRTYGWNAANSSTTRDRNSSRSADQRYDTLIHLQKPTNPNARWEMAVPNGQYRVRVVSGDAGYIDSVYRTNVEGVLAVNATPTSASRWHEGTVQVAVSDGRLTIGNASGAQNNKLCFVDIERLQ